MINNKPHGLPKKLGMQRKQFWITQRGLLSGSSALSLSRDAPLVRHTDETDHDLDHRDPNLPLWHVVQYLYGTGPTQYTRPISCRLYASHPATWAGSYRSYRSYRSGVYLSAWQIWMMNCSGNRSYRSSDLSECEHVILHLSCLADLDDEL